MLNNKSRIRRGNPRCSSHVPLTRQQTGVSAVTTGSWQATAVPVYPGKQHGRSSVLGRRLEFASVAGLLSMDLLEQYGFPGGRNLRPSPGVQPSIGCTRCTSSATMTASQSRQVYGRIILTPPLASQRGVRPSPSCYIGVELVAAGSGDESAQRIVSSCLQLNHRLSIEFYSDGGKNRISHGKA